MNGNGRPWCSWVLVTAVGFAAPAAAGEADETSGASEPGEPAGFDRVTLSDGSVLLGNIEEMVDGELSLKTAFSVDEMISVKWSEVASIETAKAMPFVLVDGTKIIARASPGLEGSIALRSAELEGETSVSRESVIAINPPPKKPVNYKLILNFGGSIEDGNTRTKSADFLGDFVARSERQRLTVRGGYKYSEDSGELSARKATGSIKYDLFITERLYAFVNTLLESDEFQDLNLRASLTGGLGYQFVDKGDFEASWVKDLELYGELGAGYFWEDYKTTEDRSYPAGRWALNLEWPFVTGVTFFHRDEGYPSFEDLRDLFIKTETGLRFNIWGGLISTIQVNWDWNSTPAPGRRRSDTRYLLTVGYQMNW